MRVLKRRRDDRGAAMVEFALILPIFVALVFGIISYGYMLSYRQGLSQAAAEGARAAAVAPSVAPSGADRQARAREALSQSLTYYEVTCDGDILMRKGKSAGKCVVEVPVKCSPGSTEDCAKITVTDNYRSNPLIPSFPGLGVTLPKDLTYTAVVEVN